MKICVINTLYYPHKKGGAEVSTQLVCEELIKLGYEVTVYTQDEKHSCDNINGVNIIRLPVYNIYDIFNYKKTAPSKIKKVIWYTIDLFNFFNLFVFMYEFNKNKFDVIWCNNLSGFSISVWFAAKLCKIKTYHTLRDYYLISDNVMNYKNGCRTENNIQSKLKQLVAKKLSKGIHFIGISDYIIEKHKYLLELSSQSDVIYNPVYINKNLFDKDKDKDKDKDTVFGYLGQLNKAKGIDTLLYNFSENALQSKLLIAGRDENNYKNNYNKNKNIDFVGFVLPEKFFKKIDVLIIPSEWEEPFGRVVIEAISYGIPVYCSENGGLPELSNIFRSVKILDFSVPINFDELPVIFYDDDLIVLQDFSSFSITKKYSNLFSREC